MGSTARAAAAAHRLVGAVAWGRGRSVGANIGKTARRAHGAVDDYRRSARPARRLPRRQRHPPGCATSRPSRPWKLLAAVLELPASRCTGEDRPRPVRRRHRRRRRPPGGTPSWTRRNRAPTPPSSAVALTTDADEGGADRAGGHRAPVGRPVAGGPASSTAAWATQSHCRWAASRPGVGTDLRRASLVQGVHGFHLRRSHVGARPATGSRNAFARASRRCAGGGTRSCVRAFVT